MHYLGASLLAFCSCSTGRSNANCNAWNTKHDSNASLKELMRLAFAPSTRATCKAGITKFKQFCLHHKMQALPADKETVVYFTVAMSRSPATIKVYLSSISTWHQQNGYKSPTSHNPILRWILKGAKKRYAHIASFPGRSRLQFLITYCMQKRRGKAWEKESRA